MNAEELPNDVFGQELLAVAREYCYVADHLDQYSQENLLEFLRKILPLLYVKGCLMKPPANCDVAFMQRYVTEETYEDVFNQFRNTLREHDEFFGFDKELMEPVKYSMSECLTDLYQDLSDALVGAAGHLEEQRTCAYYFVHQWFVQRWGAHITRVMPVLHDHFMKNNLPELSGTEFD